MTLISFYFFFILFLIPDFSFGGIQLPKNMNESDRRHALRVLAPATSARLLSSPFPLGGWQGFEVGLSRHYIPTSELYELGDKSVTQNDLEYPLLTLGKGLFYNFDLFISLIPMAQSDSITHSSVQLRFQLWEDDSQVFRITNLVYAGATTLNNQLNMQSYGFNVIGSMTMDRVSLFLGIGSSFGNGQFIGGVNGVTDTLDTELETFTLAHQLFGIEWPMSKFYWSAEVDRFEIPYYSLKLGYRM